METLIIFKQYYKLVKFKLLSQLHLLFIKLPMTLRFEVKTANKTYAVKIRIIISIASVPN